MKRLECWIVLMVLFAMTLVFISHIQEADAEKPLKFVYISPNVLGENDSLIMGKIGTEQAGAQHGAETLILECKTPEEREKNLKMAVDEGADIVIVFGWEFNEFLPQIAADSPDVQFLIVDQCLDELPPNVRCAVFREHEAAFLLGATAALLTKTNHIGVISALDMPFFHRFTDAFTDGAEYINQDIHVATSWVGGDNPWQNPERGKELALAQVSEGVDQIFAASAATNYGIFEAAAEQHVFAYGVDVNQCPAAPGFVVENLLKRIDVAVIEAVNSILNDTEESVLAYGLDSGGVGLVSLTSDNPAESQCLIMEHPEVIEKLQEIRQKIIDGDIIVHDPMAAE